MGFVHEHSKKKIILEHPALSRTNLHRILAPYQNLEKIMIKIKHPNRERERWKDRQTLFYRNLSATAGG